jgi:hypothetical protein
MRYEEEPADVFMAIAPELGGVVAVDAPPATQKPKAPTKEAVKRAILDVLPVKNKTAAASKIDRRDDDTSFRHAWAELEHDGQIERVDGFWQKSCGCPGSLGGGPQPQLFEEAVVMASDQGKNGLSEKVVVIPDPRETPPPPLFETEVCDRHPDSAWRRTGGGPWTCGVCHPPADGLGVEWAATRR